MTVSSTKNSVTHNCNGVTTDFPFDFKVFKNEDLKVYLVDDNLTLLTPDIDYAVYDLNQDSGGHIVLNIAPSSNQKISIHRILLPVQETSFPNQGAFFPKVHESAFDQVVMLIQQLINTVGSTDGGESRALLLGPADENGQGAYRANGNRISNLGEPKNDTDAARIGDIKQFSDAAETAAEAAENASQAAITASDEAKQAAQDAKEYAESIDVSSFYTKKETNAAIETAIEENKYEFYRDAPVGFVMDWEGVAPPNEKWLKYNGATFDPAMYPELVALNRYTNNKLPDVSDRYVRYIGNRTDKWLQYHIMEDAVQRMTGTFNVRSRGGIVMELPEGDTGYATGVFKKGLKNVGIFPSWASNASVSTYAVDFDNGLQARVSDETHPKTITIRSRIVKALP